MTTQSADIPMGQCTVTGKAVPEDELVTFQGQRVCAEGKAILLDRLKSGETMPGELERPGVMRRFGCIFLDTLVVVVPLVILNAIVTAFHPDPIVLGLLAVAITSCEVIYFGAMHAARGQTVGKIAGKLRVVKMDGSPISSGQAYIRALAYLGIGYLTAAAMLLRAPSFVIIAGAVVGIYGLANLLFALFDFSKQRALHDLIAGTRVIQLD
ncbi:MAG TPA: RDD family protein [Tepidisphaeraceae bacterium]|nr:RDD family protein [Tepidisphaeraceae bacterium]